QGEHCCVAESGSKSPAIHWSRIQCAAHPRRRRTAPPRPCFGSERSRESRNLRLTWTRDGSLAKLLADSQCRNRSLLRHRRQRTETTSVPNRINGTFEAGHLHRRPKVTRR